MRLIDADALLKELESSELQPTKDTEGFIDGWCEGFNTVVDMINNQPTAYDTEKVVAELERNANEKFELYTLSRGMNFRASGMSDAFEEAIDIVRKGGV